MPHLQSRNPLPGSVPEPYWCAPATLNRRFIGAIIGSPALSIFVYRIDFNKTMRAAWSGVGSMDGRTHLPVDLHILLTAWGDNADFELRILGRTMQAIEVVPLLSGPYLDPSADWAANESVQLVLEDIPTEAIMRTFDSLPTNFRLSVPYIARVIRIDSPVPVGGQFVTTLVLGKIPEPKL
jgi:Pvc16 N-terminal domain